MKEIYLSYEDGNTFKVDVIRYFRLFDLHTVWKRWKGLYKIIRCQGYERTRHFCISNSTQYRGMELDEGTC